MSARNALALVCILFVSVLLVPGVAPTLGAGPYTFTTIDFPGAVGLTEAWGINNQGQIVGDYQDARGQQHGFLLAAGTFSTIDFRWGDIG